MKKIMAFLLASAMMLSTAACGSSSSGGSSAAASQPAASEAGAESEAASGDTYKVGVLMKTMSDTYSNKLGEAIKSYAAETYKDVEILLMDAQADVNKQISQAEDLIAKQVDVVILNPQDAEGSAQVLTLCEEADIPVVEVNTQTTSDNYVSYVGSLDQEAGEIMGKFVTEQLGGKGNIAILEGNMGQSAQIYRYKGLEETILKEEGITNYATLSADWQRDKAMSTTEDWLGKYPDLNAVLCENDDMAMGALQAAEAAGRTDLIIIGVDAIPDALDAVKAGRLTATVLQDANGQASTALDVAYKVAQGETVEKEYKVPFQLITKDNVDQFI